MSRDAQMGAVVDTLSDTGMAVTDQNAVLNVSSALDNFLTYATSRSHAEPVATEAALAVRLAMLGDWRGPGGRQTLTIDHTDSYGIHWTGTRTETDSSASISATGTTATTSVSFQMGLSVSSETLETTMSCQGTLPSGAGTTARVDLGWHFRITASGGTATLHVGAEYLNDSGTLTDARRSDITLTKTAAPASRFNVSLDSTASDSRLLGEGRFWIKDHDTLSGVMDADAESFVSISGGSSNASASNGMRLSVSVSNNGLVTGSLLDSDGSTLATIGGRWLDGSLTVTYAAGGSETVYVWL